MKKKVLLILLVFCLLAAMVAGLLLCSDALRITLREYARYPECPENPETGEWYRLTPPKALSADGSRWHGKIRFGDENKLLVYFLGGGVVLDDFSATQSYAEVGSKAFYYDNDLGVSSDRIQRGIASMEEKNPFRNWNILVLPYTTGDFHIGAGKSTVHHSGYANFKALMEMAAPRLNTPEQLLIAGYSAGGFGAAMLAEEIASYFPQTGSIALCVDSALLLHKDWQRIAGDVWHAPKHISVRMQSENLTLDQLIALNQRHPEIKILFASSIRDGGLAKFQSYIDGGAYETTASGGEIYFGNLREMVAQMQKDIPDAAFYLWDDAKAAQPTRHTMLYRDDFFAPLTEETSMAQWILRALDGNVQSHGLKLLQDLQ